MKTITKTIHLYAKAKRYADGIEYWVSECDSLDVDSFGRLVASTSATFDAPELNAVAMAIEELEAEKAKAAAEFGATVMRINERLAKLQAITNEVTT